MRLHHPTCIKRQWLIILVVIFMTCSAEAQNNFCKSSFHFTPASSSNVPITPIAPATFSQLYDVNGFTWEAWCRPASTNLGNKLIIATEDMVAYQDIFLGFGFGPIPNALNFHITDNGAFNTVVDAQSMQTLTPGTWYHVAGVCDYAGAQLRLYLNGNLVASTPIPVTVLQNRLFQPHSTYIGNASASASAFDGDIDEVRFWNTARTQAQIQQNMTICMALPQAGLVAYFKADETSGASSKSAVNNNFQASLVNATWSAQYPGDNCYTINFTDNQPSCKTIDLAASVTSGYPVTNWAWNFGDGNTGSGQSIQHAYASAGTKNIKLVVTGNQGCKDSLTRPVNIVPLTINIDIDTAICSGQSYEGYSTTGVYTDNISSVVDCDTIRTIRLTVNPKPNLGNDANASMCEGTTIDLTSLYNTTAYPTVIWSTPTPANAGAGTYTLQVVNAAGCRDTATAVIQSNPYTRRTLNINLCEGQTYAGYQTSGTYIDTFAVAGACDSIRTLYLTINTKYNTIIDSTICDGENVEGYTTSGSYTDNFTSMQGCDSVRTLNLTVVPLPTLFIGKDTAMCTGDSILLDAGVFDTYRWQDGSSGRFLLVKKGGRYTVTVTSNCANLSDEIYIQDNPCKVDFPTAFSPNGDKRNDTFKALNASKIKEYHLVIFNRWGQKIFETRNPQQGWDGAINGKQAGTGTFIWYCEYSLTDHSQKTFKKGIVTMIR